MTATKTKHKPASGLPDADFFACPPGTHCPDAAIHFYEEEFVMDWISIIKGILGPIIAKCWEQTSAEDPQVVLRSSYNATTGRMDPDLVYEAVPAVRRAAMQARRQATRKERKEFPRLSNNDLYQIAEEKLIEAMNASPEQVLAVFSAAESLTEED
jgi:hypothetical protein